MKHTTKQTTGRKGFVLLTVVLVSALLIASSLMFGAQLVAESRITTTDAVFKNALSLAETGVNVTLSEIKNSASASAAWAQALQDAPHQRIGSVVPVPSMHGTYKVDVRLVGTATSVPNQSNQYSGTVEIDSTGAIYPPSVSDADMLTSTEFIARRRVQTRATVIWTYVPAHVIPGTPATDPTEGTPEVPEEGYWETTAFGMGYGVFTGGNFSTQGSALEVNGDIYAGGDANIKKNSIKNGKVYAHGTLGGNPPNGSSGGVPTIPYPVIDTAYYRALFTAYVNGTYPYDTPNNQIPGTNPAEYYTCTNPAYVGNQRAAFGVDALAALTTPVTVDGKTYRVIPSSNATAALAYMTNSTAAYFVSGDLHVNAQTTLSGTVVVDGAIVVNGGANINAGTKMPALLATGDFIKNNGNATINGLVYTEGNFTGNGTADIVGALYARGTVSMSGNMKITYDASVDSIVTGATWVVTKSYQPAVPGNPGSPGTPDTYVQAQYSICDVKQLEQSGRSWVELAPGA